MGGLTSHGSSKKLWDAVQAHTTLARLELQPTFSSSETFQPDAQLEALVRRRAAALAQRRAGGLEFAAVEDEGALWAAMCDGWS